MPRLENWSVLAPTDPYTPPENCGSMLHGEVYGHPNKNLLDGDYIRTNIIIHVEGRNATTKSGTVYELGEPDPGYLKWCEEHGYKLDPEQPLKFKAA